MGKIKIVILIESKIPSKHNVRQHVHLNCYLITKKIMYTFILVIGDL